MKRARIINAAVWAVVAVAVITAVVVTWRDGGAPVSSLVIGGLFYGICFGGFGLMIDTYLKEREL